MGAATTTQKRFQYFDDDGTESGSSAKLSIDVDWVPVSGDMDTPFRLRVEVGTVGMAETTNPYQIYLSVDDGAFAPITTVSTNGVISVASGFGTPPADNSATTERMSGSGTFTAGQWDNTGETADQDIGDGQDTEFEFCLQLDSAVLVGGEKLEFQVFMNGGAIDAYTITPTIASAPAPPTPSSDSSPAYIKGQDTASDNQVAYIKGATPASDNQAAYILGTVCPVVDIQSGAGRIKTCLAVNSYARVIANSGSESAIETLIKFTFDNTTAKSTFRVFLRGSEDWDSNVTPVQAYELAIPNDGGFQVNRITSGSRTAIGGAGTRAADTSAWWLRFRAEGTQIKVRVWADSGGEPGGWDKDIDDSGSGFSTAGVFQLAMETTTGGAEHTVTLDDISYHTPVSGTPATDRQAAYIAGTATASDNQAAYLSGSIVASDNKSAYIMGTICPVVDIQGSAGRIQTCVSLNSYGNAIANATPTSDVEAALTFSFDNITAQSKFRTVIRGSGDWDSNVTPTKGYELIIANDGGYTIQRIETGSRVQIGTGSWTAVTDSWKIRFQASGTDIRFKLWDAAGGEPGGWLEDIDDSVSGFTTAGVLQLSMDTTTAGVEHTVTLDDISYTDSGTNVTDSQTAYIAGTNTASDNKSAYIAGSLAATSQQSAYVLGAMGATAAKSSYIAGTATASDNKSAYVAGVDTATDNKSAYILGSISVSDSAEAYVAGGINVASDVEAYIQGVLSATDNKSAYIAGVDTATDNKSAYVAGVDTATDNKSAYVAGALGATASNEAYIQGVDTASDNKSAYVAGTDVAADSQSAYIQGTLGATDSKEAYVAGGINVESNAEAYIQGQLSSTDNKSAYIAGTLGATDNKGAYIAGFLTASDASSAFIAGGLADASSKQAYMAGIASTDASQGAYIQGLTFFPVTEPWTGANDDEWRRSHWVTETS